MTSKFSANRDSFVRREGFAFLKVLATVLVIGAAILFIVFGPAVWQGIKERGELKEKVQAAAERTQAAPALDLAPCKITVTQGDAPLEGASVALYSDGFKLTVDGTTDASGVAEIVTNRVSPGCPKGSFKVVIFKTSVEEIEDSTAPDGKRNVGYQLVDGQYGSVDTTPLTLEVTGETNASFDVGAPIRERMQGR